MDQELIDIFIEEIGELKKELTPICNRIRENNQQPVLFGEFAQVVDRIYGTATTMGFVEIGEYLGAIRNISRKASSSNIPRGMQEVSKLVRNCMDNFDQMQENLINDKTTKEFSHKLKIEIKKVDKIESDIFSFSKTAKTLLT